MMSKSVNRWSILLAFFSSFLISNGALVHHIVHHESSHKLYAFSLLMCCVGFTGLFAALTKAKILVRVEVFLLMCLSLATCRLVVDRCMVEAVPCPVTITSVHSNLQRATYMETMPGLYVAVDHQISYVVQTVVTESTDCNTANHLIQRMWGHMVFFLCTVIVSCMLSCWRLSVALDHEDDRYELCPCEEDVALYDVFTYVKDVPLPPKAFDFDEPVKESVQPVRMATLHLPSFPPIPTNRLAAPRTEPINGQ